MKIESMYDVYRQTLSRLAGSAIPDKSEIKALSDEIISSKKSNTLDSINVI